MSRQRIVIGVSGASGAIYGVRLLQMARDLDLETHLVMSRSAKVAAAHEGSMKVQEIEALASVTHAADNIAASISSGSFRSVGMIVAPCSIRTLSEIAYGTTSSLLTRADRQHRHALAGPPLHLGHLRAMTMAAESGAVIMPPAPAFYAKPQSIDDIVNHTCARALDLFGFSVSGIERWRGG